MIAAPQACVPQFPQVWEIATIWPQFRQYRSQSDPPDAGGSPEFSLRTNALVSACRQQGCDPSDGCTTIGRLCSVGFDL